jgi:hypothetical protein
MKKGGKKTMSDKQIVANQRNAQKYTGPKTPRGKAASKNPILRNEPKCETT